MNKTPIVLFFLFGCTTATKQGGVDLPGSTMGESCHTRLEASDGESWDKNDKIDNMTIKNAKVRCGQLYPTSPCPKIIYKSKNHAYRVVCSRS